MTVASVPALMMLLARCWCSPIVDGTRIGVGHEGACSNSGHDQGRGVVEWVGGGVWRVIAALLTQRLWALWEKVTHIESRAYSLT